MKPNIISGHPNFRFAIVKYLTLIIIITLTYTFYFENKQMSHPRVITNFKYLFKLIMFKYCGILKKACKAKNKRILAQYFII